MISGSITATGTPTSLEGAGTVQQSASQLQITVTGTGAAVLIGNKAAVVAGTAYVLATGGFPLWLLNVNLTDVWVVSTAGTPLVSFAGN